MGKHFDGLVDIIDSLEYEKMKNGIIVKDYFSRIVKDVELNDIEYLSPELPDVLGMDEELYDTHLFTFFHKLQKKNYFMNSMILGIEDPDSLVIMEPRKIGEYIMSICKKDDDSTAIICAYVVPLGYDNTMRQFPIGVRRLYEYLNVEDSKVDLPDDVVFEIDIMHDIGSCATAFLEQAAYLEKVL